MHDFSENGKNYLGKIKMNFFGDNINIYGQGLAQKQAFQKKTKGR